MSEVVFKYGQRYIDNEVISEHQMGAAFPKQEYRSVMVVGLESSGKTSLVAGLRGVRERCGRAAAGYNLDEVGSSCKLW